MSCAAPSHQPHSVRHRLGLCVYTSKLRYYRLTDWLRRARNDADKAILEEVSCEATSMYSSLTSFPSGRYGENEEVALLIELDMTGPDWTPHVSPWPEDL